MASLNRFFEPDGWQEDEFTSTTGKKIRYGHAEPAGEKKGTVVITTGYADFREAYHETIHEYLDRGYAVWMMDWAGHGGSEKNSPPSKKGQTVEDHIEDLRKFRQEVVQFDKSQPLFLSTHSMGGQVALRYLEQHQSDFNFAILATPLVEMRPMGPSKDLMKQAFAAAVEGGLANQRIKDGRRAMTRQLTAERKDMREKNPVRMGLHKAFMLLNDKLKAEDPTIGYVDSLFKSTEKTAGENFLRSIKTPVLFGIGGADDVIDNESVRRAGRLVPNAKTVEIDGGLHALWIDRDTQRKAWWKEIDGFIADQLKLKPVPPKAVPPQHGGP